MQIEVLPVALPEPSSSKGPGSTSGSGVAHHPHPHPVDGAPAVGKVFVTSSPGSITAPAPLTKVPASWHVASRQKPPQLPSYAAPFRLPALMLMASWCQCLPPSL